MKTIISLIDIWSKVCWGTQHALFIHFDWRIAQISEFTMPMTEYFYFSHREIIGGKTSENHYFAYRYLVKSALGHPTCTFYPFWLTNSTNKWIYNVYDRMLLFFSQRNIWGPNLQKTLFRLSIFGQKCVGAPNMHFLSIMSDTKHK